MKLPIWAKDYTGKWAVFPFDKLQTKDGKPGIYLTPETHKLFWPFGSHFDCKDGFYFLKEDLTK